MMPPAAPQQGASMSASQPAAAAPAPARMPPPWEAAAPQAMEEEYQDVLAEEEPPSWVTEGMQGAAEEASAPAPVARAKPATAPTEPYVITPVPELDWDGNWPALAAGLPLRGVAQQLAFQTQLVECTANESVANIRLRVPIDTLRASGNTEKLAAALTEHFGGRRINLEIDIGPVWYTAGAEAQAWREECQRKAEETVMADPFVQMLMRDFRAAIVPGSVRPPAE
jgi:DNA polymerase-3 subunit gamma/tau